MTYPCGHKNQMAGEFREIVHADGTTELERLPQRFKVRGPDAWYCVICNQIVDETDIRDKANAGS